jgi:putative PIN family toxin of toxin-antitoxin system
MQTISVRRGLSAWAPADGRTCDNDQRRPTAIMYQVVIDTNVLVAALRSRRGASFRLLDLLGDPRWQANLSVALALEYEQVAKRKCVQGETTEQLIDDILDRLFFRCRRRPVFYRWRPFLPDPKDEFVLEVAIESQCDFIVTFNTKDFAGVDQFGIVAVTPKEFLMKIGERV